MTESIHLAYHNSLVKIDIDFCTYHIYLQDYLGNNRMVVNATTDEVEQENHYYAYGPRSKKGRLSIIREILAGNEKIEYLFPRRRNLSRVEPLGEGKPIGVLCTGQETLYYQWQKGQKR